MRNRARVALAAAMVLGSGRARAEGASPSDVATAQALFDAGKTAMQAGRYDEACPKLVESQRLDPGGGTLLAIALCHEGQGKTATAWADFIVAQEQARKDNRPERVAAATKHRDDLEKKLAKVRLVAPAQATPGLEVRRDGEVVGPAQWGTPLPIDPGSHTFEARAPGKVPWTSTLPVADAPATLDVAIPALDDAKRAAPIAAPVTPAPAPVAPASSEPQGHYTSTSTFNWRTAGYITGGVGIAAIGVGLVFGAVAKSDWNDAQTACPSSACRGASAVSIGTGDANSAGHAADLATSLFVAGSIAVVAGAAIVLLAPSDATKSGKARLQLEPLLGRANGLALGGTL